MNSTHGAWGIQDRHERVISWLSGVVVVLLVFYALIFLSRELMPGDPAAASRPPASPPGPVPPATSRPPSPPSHAPIHTRIASLPTSLPPAPTPPPLPPTPRASPFPALPPVPPTPVAPAPSPSPPPVPTVATPAPPPTVRPVAPTSSPGSATRVVVRVGDAFASGSDALAFARNHDISSFRLTRATGSGDGALFLDIGPFDGSAGVGEMEALRARLGSQRVPLLLVPVAASSDPGTTSPPLPPTRVPEASPVAVRPGPVANGPGTVAPIRPSAPPSVPPRTIAGEALVEAPAPGGYSVQVASFKEPENAMNFQRHLSAKGYVAFVDSVSVEGVAWYRVMVGRFETMPEARSEADRFLAQYGTTYPVFLRKRAG